MIRLFTRRRRSKRSSHLIYVPNYAPEPGRFDRPATVTINRDLVDPKR